MAMNPSFKCLSRYFMLEKRNESELMNSTCSILVSYAITFCSHFEHSDLGDAIKRLEDLSPRHYNDVNPNIHEHRFFDIFTNSFLPMLKCVFSVPKLENDKYLTGNQILAGFLSFLRQILNTSQDDYGHSVQGFFVELRHSFLDELTLLISIVEDILFERTHRLELQEEVDNTLKELEILANEIGSFIYSCILDNKKSKKLYLYTFYLPGTESFVAGANALLEKIRIFSSTNITQHCMRFQELALLNLSSTCVRVHSFFIVDSLIQDLEVIMINNHTLDAGIKGQIKSLLDELKSSKPFLQDTEELKEPLLQIIDLSYEAEYLIHSHVAGNIPIWYINLRLPAILYKFKVNHEGLEQMNKSCKESVKSIGEGSACQHIVTPAAAADSYYFSDGFEHEKNKILDILTGEPKARTVISIYGIAGLGKTTVANELYTCRRIFDHFHRRARCVVSQTYNVRELMIQILMNIADKAKQDRIPDMKDEKLAQELYQSLVGRRYLIFLDDVWGIEVLDCLQRYFPDDRNGSRIMLTSRIKAVAPENSAFYTLPFLTKAECWDLLEKKVFQENPCPAELLGIGKGIASKCHGIPLTVVVTAGILANLEKKISVWERVEKHLDAYLSDDQNNYVKVLELSYKYLPHYLKPCFLYLGAFHEDTEISVKKLLWLWIAEGFIPKKENKSLEEIAESYLLDLINRSLLLTTKWRSDRGIKACRVHDLLRDLCIRKADEENFLKSTNYGFSIYQKHQRLYVPLTSSSRLMGHLSSHVRSFRGSIQHNRLYFPKMALLRVMESLPNEDVPELPMNLRYFGVGCMPNANKFGNIEFICIENYRTDISIPSEILRMVKLRHLMIKKLARFGYVTGSISTNLKSLSFVEINDDEDEQVLKDSHLQKLKCLCGGRREFPVLSSLSKLESLKVVFQFSPERTILSESNFPSTIKKLHLCKSAFPWEKLSVIGKLQNLNVLKLGPDAFVGKVWETTEGEFENLWFLKIEYSDLRKWITSSEHFPRLERFVLAKCYALQEIPSEIGDICTLQRIELNDCGDGVYMSALQIEKEQREYDNEELQVLITSSKWTNEQLRQKHKNATS